MAAWLAPVLGNLVSGLFGSLFGGDDEPKRPEPEKPKPQPVAMPTLAPPPTASAGMAGVDTGIGQIQDQQAIANRQNALAGLRQRFGMMG